MDSQPISDEALIGHLAQGDVRALELLYKRYGTLLHSLALRVTRDTRCAEEVLQDTFIQLWQRSHQFDLARGSLIGWLITITRNGAIDRVRRREERLYRDSPYDDAGLLPQNIGFTALEQHIARELVCTALAGLTQAQRQTIALAYFDGWACEEIADLTGTPVGTVKTRLRSALKAMKGLLLSGPDLRVTPERLERILASHG